MDLDRGHFNDAERPIVVEVLLLDTSLDERNLAPQRRGEAETDAAFHLSEDDVGIDRGAAIDGAHDALNAR